MNNDNDSKTNFNEESKETAINVKITLRINCFDLNFEILK